MFDVFGSRFGLCFSRGTGRVVCAPWKEDRAPGEGRGKLLPGEGGADLAGGRCCPLLAAKPGGEDLPGRRGVYRTCRASA